MTSVFIGRTIELESGIPVLIVGTEFSRSRAGEEVKIEPYKNEGGGDATYR